MGGALRIARAPQKSRDVALASPHVWDVAQDLPEIMTPDDAARALCVSRPTLRHMIDEGGLPVRRVGNVTRIGKRALLRWLNCEEF